MNETARFRAAFSGVEIEIEGGTDFVREQIDRLEETIAALAVSRVDSDGSFNGDETANGNDGTDASQEVPSGGTSNSVPASFGEWMHRFRTTLTEGDKALITARYVQSQSPTNDFKTSEVNKSLRDHGVKLGNPSRELDRLASKKLMFQVRKVGKLKFFRVSVDGQQHLETLLRGG